MSRTAVSLAIFAGMFFVFMPLFFVCKYRGRHGLSLLPKCLCTGLALLLCILGAIASGSAPALWLTVGMGLCLIGDLVLGLHFFAGMGAFFLGHACYVTSFLHSAPPSLLNLPAFLIPAAIMAFLFSRWRHLILKNMLPYCVYATALCTLLAFALPLPFTLGGRTGIFSALGAALFVMSDVLLCREILKKSTRFFDVLSLTLYYLGQYFLALSIYLV